MEKSVKNVNSYWENVSNKSKKEDRPFFSLAPMEAVTDNVFRRVVTKAASPDVFYTEFTNAISITHEKAKFSVQGRLYVHEDEKEYPVAQLWGKDAKDFLESSKAVADMGYKAIDINMGCPDPTVIKNGGGSNLIREQDKAKEIIEAARESNLPVSVKTRLGFYEAEEYKNWIPFLLKQKLPVLTIHLRSKKEMSKVPAHYEYIDEIIKLRDEISPETLIQVNGDIKDVKQGMELYREHPGLNGIMIGRGIFENPYAFSEDGKQDILSNLKLLRLQLDYFDEVQNKFENKRFEPLKRFFKIYVRNFSHSAKLREKLMSTTNTTEAREVIKEAEDMLKNKNEE